MMSAGGTVPTLTLIYLTVTLLVTLVLPFVGWVLLAKKIRGISSAILAGAIGFYLLQAMIRIPLLQLLSTQPVFITFAESNTELYALFLGFTAALFETVGRLAVFKFTRSKLSYNFGLGAGYGHGAIEAIYLVGLTYLNNIIFAFIINTQGVDGITGMVGDPVIAQGLVDIFAESPSSTFLIAGVERIMTVVIHIALSLIICYGFVAKKLPICVIIVLVAHTTLDTVSVLLNSNGVNIYVIELFVLAVATVAAVVIVKIKGKFEQAEIPEEDATTALKEGY